ncbi:hypothetical protein PV341_28985 [Streptomyces sp. PA03-1a]|nr:hypothetical protein [Streptomyces sp. PA03-1a]MDX2818406.1 hypothetical protein [Streptomyces sp. PA03-5A]
MLVPAQLLGIRQSGQVVDPHQFLRDRQASAAGAKQWIPWLQAPRTRQGTWVLDR